MWTVPVREVGLGRYSRIFHLSHTHCGTAPFFTRSRLNWSQGWHKICSNVPGQMCRRVSISYPGYKSQLAPGLTSPFDWIALQKPHSLSPTDWTVVTLKCFSPVGPFCSGESEIWAGELEKYKSIPRQIRMTLTWCLTPGGDSQVTCGTQSSSGPRLIIKRNHWVVWDTVFLMEILPSLKVYVSLLHSALNPSWYSLCTLEHWPLQLSVAFLSGPKILGTQHTNETPMHFLAHIWSYWQGILITRPKRYTYRHSSVLEHDQISENS